MVLDTLGCAQRYAGLHPRFAEAFRYLASTNLAALPTGRTDIDGDRLFVTLDRQEGRGREGARLEAHRRYIDIQFTIDGDEEIGWTSLAACTAADAPFDETKDIAFFSDAPSTWLRVPRGAFAIFFPEDAHAPLAGRGALAKAIVKIAMV